MLSLLRTALKKIAGKSQKKYLLTFFLEVENLSMDPLPHDSRKLAGAESLYRIRVGDYRIIYQVLHESREVIVFYIRHRSVAYRGI